MGKYTYIYKIQNAILDYGKYFHINDLNSNKIKKYKYMYSKLQIELEREPTWWISWCFKYEKRKGFIITTIC